MRTSPEYAPRSRLSPDAIDRDRRPLAKRDEERARVLREVEQRIAVLLAVGPELGQRRLLPARLPSGPPPGRVAADDGNTRETVPAERPQHAARMQARGDE